MKLIFVPPVFLETRNYGTTGTVTSRTFVILNFRSINCVDDHEFLDYTLVDTTRISI